MVEQELARVAKSKASQQELSELQRKIEASGHDAPGRPPAFFFVWRARCGGSAADLVQLGRSPVAQSSVLFGLGGCGAAVTFFHCVRAVSQ